MTPSRKTKAGTATITARAKAISTAKWLILLTLTLSSFLGVLKLQQTGPLKAVTAKEKRRLADGCYHVFLDVGANIGVHGRFLYEPTKYGNSFSAVSLFEQEFGKKRDNRDFCVFAFEPNPTHRERFEQMVFAYRAMGWRYEYIPAGVSDHTGNMTFYHMNDENFNEWGFTAKRSVEGAREEHVPVIRLASWLQEEVYHRMVPSMPFGEYETGPKVFMKMDVEGEEYRVLPDLLLSGIMCSVVDFLMGEIHYGGFIPMKLSNNFTIQNASEASEFFRGMFSMIKSAQSCKTRYSDKDDETYLHDGMPFPKPP